MVSTAVVAFVPTAVVAAHAKGVVAQTRLADPGPIFSHRPGHPKLPRGSDVIDKFSTDKLEVWGRRIDGSRRLALAKIPAEEWQGAKFTYGFLLEDNGQLPMSHSSRHRVRQR